ncbi:MAG TPA: bifunctional 23S rRNA (guanine(2069)-N(7))-methyltransferase RlmK/23S rRNA (guanine(2445)-N(2))-methyltransferase RlmL [Xanthomonadaceae bacterium]|nr:bifunctional 23S rRNA (guanine(2069)-N(7))-methyltransferase RlmK/23S rRNA (guanine(2445)-N(2))-methyltransferase RlmL [Xanthomonadaceae bacterium]
MLTTPAFATCPRGLEGLLAAELAALGATGVRETVAGVHFAGDMTLLMRACLWSRLASRILLPLAEFDAPDAAALYAGVRDIDWSAHLDVDGTLAVDANCRQSKLDHSQFVALKVKDAVVDQFRERCGQRPSVDTDRPDVGINVSLRRDRAVLSLDLSGGPLHQRGWRKVQGLAPLKENLAAALLIRAGWPDIAAAGGSLVDPMCGSGTLLIEGALIAADAAPGLRRERFGFLRWKRFDAAAWKALREEAEARAEAGIAALTPRFFGFDRDDNMMRAAIRNAQGAGVDHLIRFQPCELERFAHRPDMGESGLVLTNPPYGERLETQSGLVPLYALLGSRLRTFSGWPTALITSEPQLARATGLRAEKQWKLYNGALACVLYRFHPAGPEAAQVESDSAAMLRNRLRKKLAHLGKRARREGVTCYRVYDADLPEYAAAIDRYDAHLHVQEYQAPDTIPEAVAARRLSELVRIAGEVLEVPAANVHVKQRRRRQRGDQYRTMGQSGRYFTVEEGGLRFRVNLDDYLDTGLFLDHRPLRLRIREEAAARRFLNLFCYTGAMTVAAAAGGASATTSVDLSATYLKWAAENLALNGLGGDRHRLVQADAMRWIEAERAAYDLIYVDPPSFSNSKRAEDFDVQRDHVRLLLACAERLAPDGAIWFSNNLRGFRLDRDALAAAGLKIEDRTRWSIPFDFEHDAKTHHCFRLTSAR